VTTVLTVRSTAGTGRAAAIAAGAAALILLVTAAFHATGYPSVSRELAASSASPFVKDAAPMLWLFFSWHLVALAAGVPAAAIGLGRAARPVLFACAGVVAVDLCWVFSVAGVFAGTVLLFVAALCTSAAACLSPRSIPA
jgi:hypothetical protein